MLARAVMAARAAQPVALRAMSSQAAKPIGFSGRFLEGRSALVTGSTSGIGLGIARALAAHGANITLNGLASHRSEVDALVSQLKAEYKVKVSAPICPMWSWIRDDL